MMPLRSSFLGLASLFLLYSEAAQGTFQNRGFESASLPDIPQGQSGGYVPFANAFPFWIGYLGTDTFTQVFHNDLSLGAANISILRPNWSTADIITGHYTAFLQAGFNGFSNVDVALAQVAALPSDMQYLSLKARGGQVSAGFDGQNISLFPVGSGSNYTLYEGDIARFAGQLGELRLSSEPLPGNPYNAFTLDSINFVPIPEPSVGTLCLVGGLILGLRLRRRVGKRRQRL